MNSLSVVLSHSPLEKLNLFHLLRWCLFLAPLSICIYNGHLCIDTCNRIETVRTAFQCLFHQRVPVDYGASELRLVGWTCFQVAKVCGHYSGKLHHKKRHCHTSLKKCTGTKISSQGVRFQEPCLGPCSPWLFSLHSQTTCFQISELRSFLLFLG